MALDFPSSPTNGQTYTSSGRTWTWNSSTSTWESTNTIDFLNIATGMATPDYIQFDTTASNTTAVGKLYWDSGEGSFLYTLSGGNVTQNLHPGSELVYNGTGATLTKGQVVYLSGAQGQRPSVALALATSDTTSARTLGIVAESIANGAEGWIRTYGILEGFDTSAFTAGQQLYLSGTTAGGMTATKPSAPTHLVYVARCLMSHATAGRILVGVQNGYELDEIHDVAISSLLNNQFIKYNSSTSLWNNVTVSPTLTLSGDASGSATFTDLGNATLTVTVADDSHNHTISNVTNLQTALDAKAPLASPALTGTPTAPTATAGTNTTQLATTAFVTGALGSYYTSSTSDARYWRNNNGTLTVSSGNPFDDAHTATQVTGSGAYLISYTGASAHMVSSYVGGSASVLQTGAHYDGNNFYMRVRTDSAAWKPWRALLHSGNYNSYSPTLTGTGASGTWSISITGNAGTVTNGIYTTTNFGGDVSGTYNAIVVADDSHNHAFNNLTAKTSGTGTYTTSGDFRAPIFYDSNNTSYYVDANGTSQLTDVYANRYFQRASGIPTNNLGDPTITEMALFDRQFDNKTAFYPIANLKFFTSTDGVTWTENTSFSDTTKKAFLGGDGTSGVYIPNGTPYFRIELTNKEAYVYLNALYMYWSGSGNVTTVQIQKRRASDDAWLQHTSSTTTVGSWPGHLYMPFSTIPYIGPSSTSSGHYDTIRIDFQVTWNNANNISLYNMELWGGYPAGKRNVYTTDYDQNVSFPTVLSAGSDMRAPIFYDSDNTGFYANLASTSADSVYTAGGYSLQSGDGKGLRFWNDDSYKIYMSSTGNGTWGGRVTGETTSDYNIYFRIGGGTNRGFVFRNASTNVAGIDSVGRIYSGDGRLYLNNSTTNYIVGTAGGVNSTIYVETGGFYVRDYSGTNTRLSINSSGNVTANVDVRSPIFYDSDNTAFYFNGASTTNINALSGNGKDIFATSDSYLRINQASTFVSGIWLGSSHLLGSSGYFGWGSNGGTTTSRVWINSGTYNGSNVISIDGSNGIGTAAGSWRAPAFYDTDNTGYYIDPASSSNIYTITVASQLFVNGDARSPIFYDSDNTAYYTDPASTSVLNEVRLGNAGAITFNDRDRTVGQNAPNWRSRSVRWDFVTASQAGTGGSYAGMMTMVPWDGTAASTGDASYQMIFGGTAANGSGVPQLRIRKGIDTTWNSFYNIHHDGFADMYATSSFRAPIFYDSDNTGYYLNPNGTSAFNGKAIGVLQYTSTHGSGVYLGSVSNPPLQVYSEDGGAAMMSFHRSNSYAFNMGLDPDNYFRWGGWSASANRFVFNMADGWGTANSSWRAPLFYDSDNTNYYLDPASTSILNDVRANIFYQQDDTINRWDVGYLTLRSSSPTIYFRDTDHSSAMLHCNSNLFYILRGGTDTETWTTVGGNWPMYVDLNNNHAYFGGLVQAVNSHRAPVFYDSDNTAYYVDPTADSRLSGNLNLGSYSNIRFGGTTYAAGVATIEGGYSDGIYFYPTGSTNGITFGMIGAYSYATNQLRAPIFYDSNNTSYYIDAASESVLNTVTFFGEINLSATGQTYVDHTGTIIFRNQSGYATSATLTTGGDFTASGNVTAYSDARLKDNVETISNALDLISAMRGVTYTRKDTGNEGIGVIAQEMQQIIPQVVQQSEEGTLSVAYGNLVGVLIEAIKEQQSQITALEAKVEAILAKLK